jgi:hypothetical protein
VSAGIRKTIPKALVADTWPEQHSTEPVLFAWQEQNYTTVMNTAISHTTALHAACTLGRQHVTLISPCKVARALAQTPWFALNPAVAVACAPARPGVREPCGCSGSCSRMLPAPSFSRRCGIQEMRDPGGAGSRQCRMRAVQKQQLGSHGTLTKLAH